MGASNGPLRRLVAGLRAALPKVGRYHEGVNVRRRPYAVFLQLAFVATLLMALAPLVSRWQQAHADASVMLMPSGKVHAMQMAASPSAGVPADHGMPDHAASAAHLHHAMPMDGMATDDIHDAPLSSSAHVPAAAPPMDPHVDPHAGHGEACEYCMMASRLMPWLAVVLLLLPALPVIAPTVLRAVVTPRSLRWPAHAARGPPLNA